MEQLSSQLSLTFTLKVKIGGRGWAKGLSMKMVVISTSFALFGCKYLQVRVESVHFESMCISNYLDSYMLW